jgi:hypothetical protein
MLAMNDELPVGHDPGGDVGLLEAQRLWPHGWVPGQVADPAGDRAGALLCREGRHATHAQYLDPVDLHRRRRGRPFELAEILRRTLLLGDSRRRQDSQDGSGGDNRPDPCRSARHAIPI